MGLKLKIFNINRIRIIQEIDVKCCWHCQGRYDACVFELQCSPARDRAQANMSVLNFHGKYQDPNLYIQVILSSFYVRLPFYRHNFERQLRHRTHGPVRCLGSSMPPPSRPLLQFLLQARHASGTQASPGGDCRALPRGGGGRAGRRCRCRWRRSAPSLSCTTAGRAAPWRPLTGTWRCPASHTLPWTTSIWCAAPPRRSPHAVGHHGNVQARADCEQAMCLQQSRSCMLCFLASPLVGGFLAETS